MQAFEYNLDELQEAYGDRPALSAYRKAARELALPLAVKLTTAACGFLGLTGTLGTCAYYTMPSGDPFFIFATGVALELTVLSFSASQIVHNDPPSFMRQFDLFGRVKPTAKGSSDVYERALDFIPDKYCSPSHPPENGPPESHQIPRQ